jgi:hypothetical protein
MLLHAMGAVLRKFGHLHAVQDQNFSICPCPQTPCDACQHRLHKRRTFVIVIGVYVNATSDSGDNDSVASVYFLYHWS